MKNAENILEKLLRFLKANSESCRVCSESFAKSKKYDMAEKLLTEARTYESVIWLLEDEEFLDKQLGIFEKDMDK